MTPENKGIEQETAEGTEREQFIRQVEDHSLPAEVVLSDQQESPASRGAPTLFVP